MRLSLTVAAQPLEPRAAVRTTRARARRARDMGKRLCRPGRPGDRGLSTGPRGLMNRAGARGFRAGPGATGSAPVLAGVVVTVGAAPNPLQPKGLGLVPLDRARQGLLEAEARLPA